MVALVTFIIICFRLLLTSNFTSTHQIFPSVEILSVHFKQEKKTSHSLSFWCFHRCICSLKKKEALISLKSKHKQGLHPARLNLTRSLCSHTLIIPGLYCVKISPAQPSRTGGIYHRNLVWVCEHIVWNIDWWSVSPLPCILLI